MAYFSADFVKFFEELERNNDRDWFTANKKRFESFVKEPFTSFVDEMIMRIHSIDSDITIEAKDAIFRIYRDVRFSNDKSPYKTHMAALISAGGRRDMSIPGFYFQMSAGGVDMYGGAYKPDRDQLINIRRTLSSEPKKIEALLNDPAFKRKYGGELQGEKNKKLPPEFREAAEKQPLIFNKGFYYHGQLSAKKITAKDLPEQMIEFYEAGRKVNRYLHEAMLA